jgi:diaminobutyrate-2-oxoglutarate transaminase
MTTIEFSSAPAERSSDTNSYHQWTWSPTTNSASEKLISRQKRQESNARTYAKKLALALRSAKGVYVEDMDGKTYIDCLAGAGTLALGHNHPEVVQAIRKALDDELPLHTLDITTPIKDEFTTELFASLPESMRSKADDWRVQFCSPAGTDGVEAAIKLAKIATGRHNVIAFHGAYHGMTHGALSLTGNLDAKGTVSGLMPGVSFMPYPYPYRCPFGIGDKDGLVAARYFENTLKDPESGISKPAAVILEAVQGEGGVIPAPIPWLREIRRVTEELGIPLILDEVQAGVGRTGWMYAFERAGIEPDIFILSKAIGGSLPLALIMYRQELDVWESGAHTGTFRGNQLAMAAGVKTLQIVNRPEFLAEVRRKGAMLRQKLAAANLPFVGEIRGEGLMTGIEIVDPFGRPDHLGARPHLPAFAAEIQQQALSNGLIVELGGRFGSVVRLLPPLVIDNETCDKVIDRLLTAMTQSRPKLSRGV